MATTETAKTGLRAYPRVYFETLMIGFSLIMGMGLVRSFLPLLASDLDPTRVLVGFVTSAWFFARAFVEIPGGLISLKIGKRRLIVIGALMGTMGSIISGFSQNIYMLIAGQAIWGCGAALFFTCNTALIMDLFKPEARGKALGTFQSIEFIGNFLGAPVGAALAVLMGYTNIFFVTSSLLFFAFMVAFTSRGLKHVDIQRHEIAKNVNLGNAVVSLKSWGLIATSFINLCRVLVTQGVMQTVIQLYLKTQLNASLEFIGLLLGLKTLGMVVATFISGHLADKIGAKPLVIIGCMIDGACLYLYPQVSDLQLLLLLATIDGSGTGFVSTSLIVLMSEQVPASVRSGAVGVYRTFMDIGGIIGPIIFMMVYNSLGASAPFTIASVVIFSNIAIALVVKSTRVKSGGARH